MSKITRQDTNGVKPLLATGELGYDNYPAGGDVGRVYVGTGTENVAIAKKSEVDTKLAATANAVSATKLQTARTITLSGDVAGSTTFDGSGNVVITTIIADDSHNHTIANVAGLQTVLDGKVDDSQVLTNVPLGAVFTDTNTTYTAGTGVSLTGTVFANTSPNVSTNLSYTTAATTGTVVSSDGTNATIPAATTALAGLMTNVDKTKLDGIAAGAQVNVATNLTATAGTAAGPTINSSTGTNVVIPSASATASGVVTTGTQTIAGAKTFSSGIVGTLTGSITGNAGTATKLATARTINGVAFDGSANIAISSITNPSITGSITEQVYNLTGTAISPANGTIQYKTVSANTTFTETLTDGQSVLLRLIGAYSYTITFPTITWVGAVAPTLTANCAIVLWKEQSTLYGAYVGTLV